VQPFECKVERIGACKEWKTGDELDLDHRRDLAKSIIQHESNCELSADGDQSHPGPTLVDESTGEGLNVLQKGFGTCVGRLVRGGGRYHFGRSTGIWRSLANLSNFLAAWLSSDSTGVDDRGRSRPSESHPTEEHVRASAKVFEELCQAGDVFCRCRLSQLRLGAIMPKIGLELWDSRGLQYLPDARRWKIRPTGPPGSRELQPLFPKCAAHSGSQVANQCVRHLDDRQAGRARNG